MLSILNVNSLVHWEEREILRREDLIRHFSEDVKFFLRSVNSAGDIRRVEAPTLIPRTMISTAYENADVWVQQRMTDTDTELVLRPETTLPPTPTWPTSWIITLERSFHSVSGRRAVHTAASRSRRPLTCA